MTKRIAIVVVLAVLVGLARLAWPVRSAPLTSGAKQKLTVYQGVVTVAPGQVGDSTMELGNLGREIASTGALTFRSNSGSAGAQFVGAGGNIQNLNMTGDAHADQGFTLGGVTKTAWSQVGGGPASYWEKGQIDLGSPGFPWLVDYVRPTDLSRGVKVTGVSAGPALSSSYLVAENRSGGTALEAQGDVVNIQDFKIYGDVRINGATVWSEKNDGAGSGLDAALLDEGQSQRAGGAWLVGLQGFIRDGRMCWATACFCFKGWDNYYIPGGIAANGMCVLMWNTPL